MVVFGLTVVVVPLLGAVVVVEELAGATYGAMMQSTGRKNSCAVWPTTLRTAVSFLAPGSSITMLLPWTVTFELETPRPLTRLLIICWDSFRSAAVTWPCGFSTTDTPPCKSRPEKRRRAGNDRDPDADYGDCDYEYEAPSERAGAHRLAFFAGGLDTTVLAGRYVAGAAIVSGHPLTRWCLRPRRPHRQPRATHRCSRWLFCRELLLGP